MKHLNAASGSSYRPSILRGSIGRFLVGNLLLWKMGTSLLLIVSVVIVLLGSFSWRRDLSRESTFKGTHSQKTQMALKLGIVLFIFREVMLFFSFFWAYFHYSLNPTVEIGLVWPRAGISRLDRTSIPLLNTVILVSRGISVTLRHYYLVMNNVSTESRLQVTIGLGLLFLGLQAFEYYECSFSIISANYGAIFFIATGFHGGHVTVGAILLSIRLVKIIQSSYTRFHHLSYEMSIWYWHFVDVVWLFLYTVVYWWSS